MMRGRSPLPADLKAAQGTLRVSREKHLTEVAGPNELPQAPDWLTQGGKEVWLDNIGRLSSIKMATEIDTEMFATFCNLQAANISCWRRGKCPPIASIRQAMRVLEQFGLAGRKSRIVKKEDFPDVDNPFSINGRKVKTISG